MNRLGLKISLSMLLAGLMLMAYAYAQAPPAPPPPAVGPQLSTAEKRALQADETQKKQAQDSFMQAQQDEVAIEREFAVSHAGWRVNPVTFGVEKDVPMPEPKKPALAPGEKKDAKP